MHKRLAFVLLMTIATVTHGIAADGAGCLPAMDARTRAALARTTGQTQARKQAPANGETRYISMIVRLGEGRTVADLEEAGAVIFHHRGNLALCCIPAHRVDRFLRGSYVDRVQLSRPTSHNSNLSRASTHIDQIHAGTYDTGNGASGTVSGGAYDGSGVVAGICDTGFDPAHIAWGDRLGMMSHYVDSLGLRRVWAPGTSLHTGDLPMDADGTRPLTDNADESHGTHVLNILGGGYRGNPYYGGAPGARLAISCSDLSDVDILSGLEDIIAYAAAVGMPAVANVSAGSYLGPHDGTDLFCQYLDMLGREAIITMSAGNNGTRDYSLRHVLGADSPGHDGGLPTVGTMLESSLTWNGFGIRGALDVWSADAHAVDMRLVCYDQIDRRVMYRSRWFGPHASQTDPGDSYGAVTDSLSGTFHVDAATTPAIRDIMPGTVVRGGWTTDADNGRFNIAIEYNIDTRAELPGHHWARYVFGWEVRGAPGTHIDAYTDGVMSFMRHYGAPGMLNGTPDNTISDLLCGHGAIAVGAWNTRNVAPVWGAPDQHFNFDTDNCAEWSSYGTLLDGRRLPHFCAPGNVVLSAMSGPYADAHPDEPFADLEEVDGHIYRWMEMCGTSMASPMAAAVMALWLQADPQLTRDKALETATETARRNFSDIGDPRWGAGALDAVAGLQRILGLHGIGDISVDSGPVWTVRVVDGRIVVDGDADRVSVCDLYGRRVSAGTTVSAGLYLVGDGKRTVKVAVGR